MGPIRHPLQRLPARLPVDLRARSGTPARQSHRKGEGAAENSYTAGVICSKVARYAERIHHPQRLVTPLRRTGPKGSGQFTPVSWSDALDETAEAFLTAAQAHGSETVWPYYYAGTMGLVMRDGINRLRHAMRYPGSTRRSASPWPGPATWRGPADCQAAILVRWPAPTWSSSGVRTPRAPRSTS